jgi:hypothetical protein
MLSPQFTGQLNVIDLTPLLKRKTSRGALWSVDQMLKLAHGLLSAVPGASIDWDDGEGWASVLSDGEMGVVAIVSACWPLILCNSKAFREATQANIGIGAEVVCFDAYEAVSFSVDRQTLEFALGRRVTDALNYSAMSAADFWYSTI